MYISNHDKNNILAELGIKNELPIVLIFRQEWSRQVGLQLRLPHRNLRWDYR